MVRRTGFTDASGKNSSNILERSQRPPKLSCVSCLWQGQGLPHHSSTASSCASRDPALGESSEPDYAAKHSIAKATESSGDTADNALDAMPSYPPASTLAEAVPSIAPGGRGPTTAARDPTSPQQALSAARPAAAAAQVLSRAGSSSSGGSVTSPLVADAKAGAPHLLQPQLAPARPTIREGTIPDSSVQPPAPANGSGGPPQAATAGAGGEGSVSGSCGYSSAASSLHGQDGDRCWEAAAVASSPGEARPTNAPAGGYAQMGDNGGQRNDSISTEGGLRSRTRCA